MNVAYRLSRHAETRARQRGILKNQISAVVNNADRSRSGRNGAEIVWVSDDLRMALGPVTREGVDTDRLKNLYVLIKADGCIVTNYRGDRLR